MSYVMIAILANISCMMVLCILLMGLNLHKEAMNESSRKFSVLIYSALLMLFVNLLSSVLDGRPEFTVALYIINLLTFLTADLLVIAFCYYMYALLGSERGRPLQVVVATAIISIITEIILVLTGNLFSIENGYYTEQANNTLAYLISGLIIFQFILIIIRNRDFFSIAEFSVIMIYLFIPVPAVIIESYFKVYNVLGIAITLSILLIYVLIQADLIERSRTRESLLEEITNTDILTGLNNRRAFYNAIASFSPSTSIGVIFCDINGLKYTNDHFGHAAGDEKIRDFAKLLTTSFRKDESFRISGDEFIVLMPSIESELFTLRVDDFNELIKENGSIAAIGHSYGSVTCFDNLLSEAENAMYRDKKSHQHKR